MPKLMLAVALLLLVALASTLTYTGYLVIGVLAECGLFVVGKNIAVTELMTVAFTLQNSGP